MKPGILFALMFIFTTCSVSGGIIEIKSGFISGTVAADNDKMTQKSLTSGQLHSIEQWLQEHRSGWKGMLTEAGINEHHVLTFSFR
ncbi:MAG: hypothetical protein ABUL58_01405, partial [Steroidobacter sp.]